MSSSNSQSAQALLKSVPIPPLRHQPIARLLLSSELEEAKKQIHKGWEQETILSIFNNPETKAFSIDLIQGSKLTIVTEDSSVVESIGQTADAVLTWMGAAPNLNIYLWYRRDPRLLRADQWPTKKEVNGGWTILPPLAGGRSPSLGVAERRTFINTTNIVIYRQEEWERVLIHEVIHAMRWDWKTAPIPAPCWKMNKTDVLTPHLFEAWTELFAEWLACAWYGVPWEEQRKWQDFQAVQLLARARDSWQENTSVFAYYVLKAALAPHFEFLWVAGHGQTEAEESYIMCGLVTPQLERLREIAKITRPINISLRMSLPRKN